MFVRMMSDQTELMEDKFVHLKGCTDSQADHVRLHCSHITCTGIVVAQFNLYLAEQI